MPASLHINAIATSTGVHVHDHQQLMIGLDGRMDCDLPSVSASLVRASVGFLPSGTLHRYAGRDSNCRVLVLDYQVDDPFITALFEASGEENAHLLNIQEALLKPSVALDRLLGWYASVGRLERLYLPAVRNQIISGILTEVMIGQKDIDRVIRHSRICPDALQNWVDTRLSESISVAAMANAFYLSESHLYVAVKNLLGCSPAQFITQRRMHQAIALLKQTRLTIGHIAIQVGYADTASFSKAFHRYFGASPRAYRQS